MTKQTGSTELAATLLLVRIGAQNMTLLYPIE